MDGNGAYGLKSEESLSISDDDSILDFSSSRVTMPLDDQDVRLMQGQTRMCEACQVFSKPVCVHNQPSIERGIVPYSNGCISRRNGYQALAQVGTFLP